MIILMRGWQGSGKSTLAKSIARSYFNPKIFSTDDYWEQDGEYRFDPERLTQAHEWNINRVGDYCRTCKKQDIVIVDNCNIKCEHMVPYEKIAREFGHMAVQAIVPDVLLVRELLAGDENDQAFARSFRPIQGRGLKRALSAQCFGVYGVAGGGRV